MSIWSILTRKAGVFMNFHPLLLLYLIIMNLVGFFIMGIDKSKAQRGQWRIPERTLFGIAMAGGSLGMRFGMYTYHHKTRHASFVIGIPVILIIQLILLILYLTN